MFAVCDSCATPFTRRRVFCMAQWAYSNHPTDASYSSSLSVCTLQEPVFLFFCTAPTDARLTYIPLTRFKGGDGTVRCIPTEKNKTKITYLNIYKISACRASSCVFFFFFFYVVTLVLEQNTNTQPLRYLVRVFFPPNLTLRFGVDMLWNPKHAHNNHFVEILPDNAFRILSTFAYSRLTSKHMNL